MPGRTDHPRRMAALLLVFVLFGTLATVRLAQYHVVEATGLAAKARTTFSRPAVVWQPRADILDRHGAMLAQTTSLDMLVAYPELISEDDVEGIVNTLDDILGLRSQRDRQAYLDKLSSGKPWTWLERHITPEQSIEVQLRKVEGLLPGIGLDAKQVRLYPRSAGDGSATLASHLLGFVDASGHGMYGVERAYDARLRGETDTQAATASLAGTDLGLDSSFVPPLGLTIDSGLQKQLETELVAARIQDRAASVSAIILDPYTGEILASATAPAYDANESALVASRGLGALRDPVIGNVYEPGSVMKTFTLAAVLDKGVVTPNTPIQDQKVLRFGPYKIRNASRDSMGTLKVKDVIANSRNVATAKMARRLARNTKRRARALYEMWERVGVVGKTGVDLASEESGIAADPANDPWVPHELANRSFGQAVSVTLMQLATGYAPFINGGFRVQPHVVNEEGSEAEPERVLSAKVARQVRDILVHVTGSVTHYSRGSLIPGYLIGGKTGTAQIWDVEKNAWKNRFNNTFVGFVGSDEPEALIAVRIEEPRFSMADGFMDLELESYELFRKIAKGAIKHLGIKRSKDPDAGLPIRGTAAARVLTPERSKKKDKLSRAERRKERSDGEGDAGSGSKRDRSGPGAGETGGPDAVAASDD